MHMYVFFRFEDESLSEKVTFRNTRNGFYQLCNFTVESFHRQERNSSICKTSFFPTEHVQVSCSTRNYHNC